MPPPLSNLLAVHHADDRFLARVRRALEADASFASVWSPAGGWVVAAAPLGGSAADSSSIRDAGLAFAEGRDRVQGGPADRSDRGTLTRLIRIADQRPEDLDRFAGDFTFLRFRDRGRLTAVRSCGGLAPVYVATGQDWVTAGTRLDDIVRYAPVGLRIDRLVHAIWAALRFPLFPDHRTVLDGVSIVPRGHAALVGHGRTRHIRYWDPRPDRLPEPTEQRCAEHARRFRAAVLGALERDLDTEGNLLLLSGGVDSSSLAALAAGHCGRPVWAWSLLPEQPDLHARELSYIQPLLQAYGCGRHWTQTFTRRRQPEMLRAAPPVVLPILHPGLCALPSLCQEADIRVLFGGEFADEVGGSRKTVPDWAAHSSPALIARRGLPLGARDPLRWIKWRLAWRLRRPPMPFPAGLPPMVARDLREEYREWWRHQRRQAAEEEVWPYLTLWSQHDGWVAQSWEATSALGVRRAFPFFTREILELAHGCHPAELIGPGTKALLRRAFDGLVPARNLHRPDKASWRSSRRRDQLLPADELTPEMASILADSGGAGQSPVPVDEAAARAILAQAGRVLQARRHQRTSICR